MTQQEKDNLDRVFGRIHVHSPGSIRPLVPDKQVANIPLDKATEKKVPGEAPPVVAKIAPKDESSALLIALRGTLPPAPDVVTKSKPAS